MQHDKMVALAIMKYFWTKFHCENNRKDINATEQHYQARDAVDFD